MLLTMKDFAIADRKSWHIAQIIVPETAPGKNTQPITSSLVIWLILVPPSKVLVSFSIEVRVWQRPQPALGFVIQAYPHLPLVTTASSCDQTLHVFHVVYTGQVCVLFSAVPLSFEPSLWFVNEMVTMLGWTQACKQRDIYYSKQRQGDWSFVSVIHNNYKSLLEI